MPKQFTPSRPAQVVITTEWVLRGFGFVLLAFATFFLNQLNRSIDSLTGELKAIETHSIETDKRLLAIEVSRQVTSPSYEKVVADVQEMKMQVAQMNVRSQTISDFISKKFELH